MARSIRVVLLGALVALLAACSPVQILNGLTPNGGVQKVLGVAYGPDPRNRLDIYSPPPGSVSGLAPVVVFFYGGSWNSGRREDYTFVGQALAARGIVTVVADYRLYPQVRYPDFLTDNAQAVGWTFRHVRDYGGDPQQLFLMGHSSGAYNAAMLALDPRQLAAVGLTPADLRGWIGLAGPYDFLPIDVPAVKPVFFFPNSPPDSQPINHVSHAAPPTLLMASNGDQVVDPQRNTAGLAKRLQAAGVPVEVHYFDRTGHGSLVGAFAFPLRFLAPVLDDVVAFVQSDARRRVLPMARDD